MLHENEQEVYLRHELRNLTWNCKSMAKFTGREQLRGSLTRMASRFELDAEHRQNKQEPNESYYDLDDRF